MKHIPIKRIISVFIFFIFSSILVTTNAQSSDDMKAVLITGTSSGIGLKMTEVLSQNGFFVYAGVRNQDDYKRLNAMKNVQAVQMDVTIQSEIDAAVKFIESEGKGLYGLINNAGVAVMGALIDLSEEDMDFQLDVNLFGPYRVTKAFSDLIIESEGRVMTTGSIAGILSGQTMGAYSMSKHGVEAFTDALASEMAQFNVQVAVVEPGNYKSQIAVNMLKRLKESDYSAEGARFGNVLQMLESGGNLDRGQYKEPDEVAAAALHFMTSDEPKRRYMVVPNEAEADITIRQVLNELVQLNEGQPYTFSRDQLVSMLDQALGYVADDSSGATSEDMKPTIGLQQAAMTGDVKNIKLHIKAGSDLDEKEPMGGSTPLITAATFGKTEVAKALIKGGANVDLKNNDGSTALLTAAFFCRTEILKDLLAAGADKNIRNNSGASPLDVVSAPFSDIKNIYDYVGGILAPMGLKLDYERIEKTRPNIAKLLR